ncbi:MAG: hypothetical protein WDN10_02160 [bacterium]
MDIRKRLVDAAFAEMQLRFHITDENTRRLALMSGTQLAHHLFLPLLQKVQHVGATAFAARGMYAQMVQGSDDGTFASMAPALQVLHESELNGDPAKARNWAAGLGMEEMDRILFHHLFLGNRFERGVPLASFAIPLATIAASQEMKYEILRQAMYEDFPELATPLATMFGRPLTRMEISLGFLVNAFDLGEMNLERAMMCLRLRPAGLLFRAVAGMLMEPGRVRDADFDALHELLDDE